MRQDVINELHSFHLDAVKVLKDSLHSENDSVKIKVAFWLIEKLAKRDIGNQDARAWIKDMCSTDDFGFDFGSKTLDEKKYHQFCQENNLADND